MGQQFVEIDGQLLRVGIWPNKDATGPSLYICNGFSTSLERLEPFINALDGIQVVSFNAPARSIP